MISRILVTNNVLKAIVEMSNLDLLSAGVDGLRSPTMLTLGCHLYQHVKLLDGHLRKVRAQKHELELSLSLPQKPRYSICRQTKIASKLACRMKTALIKGPFGYGHL